MATINSIEDLLRLLDENPEWLEALRARLLTRELLELPQTVANLSVEVAALSEKMAALSTEVAALSAEVKAFIAATNARFDKVEGSIESLTAATNARFDKVEGDIQSLRDDMGPLKGGNARIAVERNAAAIADDMGLRLTAVLSQAELFGLTDHTGVSNIPKNTMRSFRRADLVIEARDTQGETCYVAVEISYTVNGRDTERAIRNAELLTRFTGKAARAAVAGARLDERIRDHIDSGAVFWFELTPELLDVA